MNITPEQIKAAATDSIGFRCFRNAAPSTPTEGCSQTRAIIVMDGATMPAGTWEPAPAAETLRGLDRLYTQAGVTFYGRM